MLDTTFVESHSRHSHEARFRFFFLCLAALLQPGQLNSRPFFQAHHARQQRPARCNTRNRPSTPYTRISQFPQRTARAHAVPLNHVPPPDHGGLGSILVNVSEGRVAQRHQRERSLARPSSGVRRPSPPAVRTLLRMDVRFPWRRLCNKPIHRTAVARKIVRTSSSMSAPRSSEWPCSHNRATSDVIQLPSRISAQARQDPSGFAWMAGNRALAKTFRARSAV